MRNFLDADVPFRLIVGGAEHDRINQRHFNRGARARCFRPDLWRSLEDMVNDEARWSRVVAVFVEQLTADISTSSFGDRRLTVDMSEDVGWLCALPGDNLPQGASYEIADEWSVTLYRFISPHLVAPRTTLVSFTIRTSRSNNSGRIDYQVFLNRIYPGPDLGTWERGRHVSIPVRDSVFFHPDSPGAE